MALYPDACSYDEFITKLELGYYHNLTAEQYVEIIKELVEDLSTGHTDEEFESLEQEKENLECDINNLEREIVFLENTIESLRDEIDNLNYENKQLRAELEELNNQ